MKRKTRLKTCMVILLSVVMMLSLSATVFATEGDTQTVGTVDELKNALSAGGSITLSDNITLTEPLDISKGVIINGASHTITDSTGALSPMFNIETSDEVVINGVEISGAVRGFDLLNEAAKLTLKDCTVNVSQRGVTCSLNSYDGMSLVLDNTKINNTKVTNYKTEAVYDQHSRGISLWGTKNSAVTLKKGSEINGFSYCINVSGPQSASGVADTSGLKVTVDDSDLRGWTGFNVWGSQATYTLKNSTVLGINTATGNSNNFSAITFNDDIYDQFANAHSENNILNIKDSTIKNYQNGPCTEQLLRIDCGITKLNLSGTVNFVDTTGNSSTALYLAYMDDPATFLKESVNTEEGATIICTTVKDNKTVEMNFAPEYTAYYYWSDGEGGYTGVYCDFKDIFTSSAYTLYAGEYIDLLEDVALDEDVTAELEDLNEGTGSFYLNLKGHSVTGAKIILPTGVSVITDSAVNDLFAAQDGGYIISSKNEDGDTYTYQSVGVKEGNVAAIGATQYSSLSGAIKAAQTGDTITLLADIKKSVAITENQNITLDLNGKTLTNEDGKDTISVDFGATLTVVGDGTVQNGTQGYAAVYNNGTAVLNGGAYTRAAEKWYTICNHGEMTINDGVTVTVASDVDSTSSMIENGYYKYSGTNPRNNYVEGTNQAKPKLTINGGTFSGGLNTVKNDDGGVLEITGGDFTNSSKESSSAVIYNASEAAISGGTLTSISDKYAIYNLKNNVTVDGEKISTVTEVFGGTFDGKVNVASGTTMTVSGGNFTVALKEAWCADTYVPTTSEIDGTTYYTVKTGEDVVSVTHVDENGNSTTQNYISLAKAVAAAESGDTITLLDDIELSEYVQISGKSLTLDLAGYTITRLPSISASYLFYIRGSSDLIVTDSSSDKTGIINGGDNPTNYSFSVNGSKVTVTSGTICGNSYGVYVASNGKLDIQGGKLNGGTSGIYLYNGTADVTVSGGEVTGDSYGIYNLYGTVTVKEDADITGGTYGILAGKVPTGSSNVTSASTINIESGNITGGTAGVCMGNVGANSSLNVTGGTITGSSPETSYGIYSASAKASAISVVGGEISGAAYGIYEASTVAPTMSISSGDTEEDEPTIPVITTTSENGVALQSTNCTGFVSGGRFSSKVLEEYCAEGYAPATLDEETNQYTVKPVIATIGSGDDVKSFTSLAEAVKAAKTGDTVTVIKDTTIGTDETITIAEGVTLTISDGAILTNKGTIDVYGTLTNASGIEGEGTIKYHVQNITISSEALTLKVDETNILTATTNPANAVDEITWSSSDEKIATVDKDGNVTAVAAGKATITVTANGKTATCTVTISKKDAPAAPTGIAGENETVQGKKDGKITGVTDEMEYRLKTEGNTEEWTKCTAGELTGLAPGTYEIRMAETDDTEAGQAAKIIIATGDKPTYTLNVSAPTFDTAEYGYNVPQAKPITINSTGNSDAAITSVKVSDENAFEISGNGETVSAGSSINTWAIQPKSGLDAGTYEATITVIYNNKAEATATVSFTVSKASQSAPAAAAVKDKTYTSITLEPIADNENGVAAQYSIDGGQTWQDSNVFENLLPGIEYSFTVRYAAVDGKYTASAASEATAISTKIGANEDTVTPDDKDALTEEKQELEKALKSDAYTDEEKAMLNDRIGEIDAAFTALENAEKTSDLIEALPNADDVTKDDADDINAAKAAYDKLTNHEKTLVGDEAKAKLDAAIKALEALNDDEEAANNGSEKDDDAVIVSDASKTGDNMNLLSWSIIALTAILVAGLIVVFRRKKHINR